MSKTLKDRVDVFLEKERPVGIVLDEDVVREQALTAARFYAGFANFGDDSEEAIDLSEKTLVSESEWALIRPLFLLYIERETAIYLEASRNLGLTEAFARSQSEVASEIANYEANLPVLAFSAPVLTI